MAERISWTLDVRVASGPTVLAAGSFTCDAYDKITAVIPADASGITVDVQPGNAERIKFLLIKSTVYHESLTYDVGGGVSGVKLDALQMLMGDGVIGLLDSAPKQLTFKNAIPDQDAAIEILVGREAVPPAP